MSKIVEWLLWIGGVSLVGVFVLHLVLSEFRRTHAIAEFRQQQLPDRTAVAVAFPADRPTSKAESEPIADLAILAGPIAPPDKSLWSSGRIASFAASLNHNSGEILGIFSAPRLGLEVPLYDGASELHMDRGIARIEGTAMPGKSGNMGIAGHRDGYFRVLKDIRFGDDLIFTTTEGIQNYRVQQIMIVDPSVVSVLDPTPEPAITLVTCYPFYFVGHAPERFIVRAVLLN